MKPETQQLLDYIKSAIQTCAEADRKTLAETKAAKGYVPCPMKDGYASGFVFRYEDGTYGLHRVYGFFEYEYKVFECEDFSTEEMPLASLSFLTKEEYENEMHPALISWLEEKVRNEPFGGIYSAKFSLEVSIDDRRNNYARSKTRVSVDSVRQESQREMVCAFLRDKKYETMDFGSEEFKPVTKDLFYILPNLFGRVPVETLKDAIDTMTARYTAYDTYSTDIDDDVLWPLSFGCLDKLRK